MKITPVIIANSLKTMAPIVQNYPESSEERKALNMSFLALFYILDSNNVPDFESFSELMEQDLTEAERRHLESMGIEP